MRGAMEVRGARCEVEVSIGGWFWEMDRYITASEM